MDTVIIYTLWDYVEMKDHFTCSLTYKDYIQYTYKSVILQIYVFVYM